MALTEKQIRQRILEVIWEIAPDSKRIYRNVLTSSDRTKWAGLFYNEPEDEDVAAIAYAYVVRRTRTKGTTQSLYDSMTFEILGFRGHNAGTEAENSENIFQAEIDQITNRFLDRDIDNPAWEFTDESDEVSTIEIEFSPIGLIQSSELLHFGGGRLVVQIERC